MICKADADQQIPARRGKPPKPLCCPDTDSLWFPGGVSEAVEWLERRGHRLVSARAIYHAITTGDVLYGLTWDFADADARERYP